MASGDGPFPQTKSHPLTTETRPRPLSPAAAPPAKSPRSSGVHNFITGHHSSNPSHEPEHHKPIKPFPAPAARGRGLKGDQDRHFLSSDDNAFTKQIVATHAGDFEDLDVKPVLSIIEDIIRLSNPSSAETTRGAQVQSHSDEFDHRIFNTSHHDDKIISSPNDESEIVRILADPINKISGEIICKCSAGGESHAITMDLLKSLSSYSWDSKVVITFAAFAINCGEFWLVEQLHTQNPLAKYIATFKDLPDIMAHAGELQKKFEAVLKLLNAVIKLIHCIIAFKELSPHFISRESPEIMAATAHIPTAVYWIIRSLLVCATTLLNLIGSGHEYVAATSESWEILSLTHKLSVTTEHLENQLRLCRDLIEKKKAVDAYTAFRELMETVHIDNMKVIRAIIHSREDQRPLYDGSRKTNERLEMLKMKYVLLLISDLEFPHEELNVLHLIYNQQTMGHEYEVLWLPIIDPSTPMTPLQDTLFYDLRNNSMPWLSVDHPSLVEHVAIRYVREVWNFVHWPMLVVLDPQGKPSNLDALPMMWIWGGGAFPFTKTQERKLWADCTWNIELLVDNIDQRFQAWIKENSVICLYGGEDIEWIRKFTLSARAATNAAQVNLQMLYVGKRNPKEKVRKCHECILNEKLSHIFPFAEYYDYIWFFWIRLWSMWNSKKQIGVTVETDRIMQEIMGILAYDSSEHGWAVFSRGNFEITKSDGEKVLPILQDYNNWIGYVDHPDKFVPVLDEQLRGYQPEHHCNHLILPGYAGYIPEQLYCADCGKLMDKHVMYRCCTD